MFANALCVAMLLAFPLAAGCGDGGDGGDGGGTGGAGGAGGGAASSSSSASSASTGGGGTAECAPDVDAPEEVLPGATDPEAGMFTLDEALAELPEGPGPLRAIIDTDEGEITCELFPEQAPNAVANFVGLARGRRPWQDPATDGWVKRRFYDGLTFHRVIPEFMAQGGDPLGTGEGWPGYEFDDEISELKHRAGTLAYANAGADTNGSQFYITEVATDWLDGAYTIFGQCAPVEVVTAMTHVETDADDKPLAELRLRKVTITRCAP
ncbi:peptidylprolyl isomerase [Sorangium sp. So ce1078]|uniref:peptidylprolyl isomerase n=1 Tax=Sorangium sp. So ce1078 TaxID=3133329 RepID=UPI003F5D5FEC